MNHNNNAKTCFENEMFENEIEKKRFVWKYKKSFVGNQKYVPYGLKNIWFEPQSL